MLRITTERDDAMGVVLKLEGRLVGIWVGLLQRIWENHDVPGKRPFTLNLAFVGYASAEGVDLLCHLRRQGVVCSGCPPFLRALCDKRS